MSRVVIAVAHQTTLVDVTVTEETVVVSGPVAVLEVMDSVVPRSKVLIRVWE